MSETIAAVLADAADTVHRGRRNAGTGSSGEAESLCSFGPLPGGWCHGGEI